MKLVFALLSGLLFGAGLTLSGMTDPAIVRGFLNLFGAWNPSLIFVMGGALATTFIGYHFILKREKPLFGDRFDLPAFKRIDAKLMFGAALFGLGWGLSGYCPGPAVASLANPSQGLLAFLGAYTLSTALTRYLMRKMP